MVLGPLYCSKEDSIKYFKRDELPTRHLTAADTSKYVLKVIDIRIITCYNKDNKKQGGCNEI